MKSKKIYKSTELLGIENRESSLLISKGHASLLRNLIGKNGILKKRNGWQEDYHYRDKNDKNLRINGIFEYQGRMVVHAGEYLFDGDKSFLIRDTKSCGLEKNGLLYITCGELFIYDGNSLTEAYNSAFAYVPLTSYHISPIGYESTTKTGESPSLLTDRRKNRLTGIRKEGDRQSYKLDGKLDISKPIEIKTRLFISLNSQRENEAPYNAIYNEEAPLLEDNVEGVIGLGNKDVIFDILSGKGTENNLGAVEEVGIMLRRPIKITTGVFEGKDGFKVPKISFYLGSDLVYETEGVSDSQVLDLTETLFSKTIDAIYLYGNSEGGAINKISITGRLGYEGEIEITHNLEKISYDKLYKATKITDTSGKELTLSLNEDGSSLKGASVMLTEGIDSTNLCFDFCNASPIANESNIEITYSVTDTEALKCNIGEICKSDTGESVIALAYKNNLYISKDECYFPLDLKRTIGRDGDITAICEMNDNIIGVFKSRGAYYYKPDGTLTGYSAQGGALSHLATKTVNLDTLSPQNDNIYGSVGTGGRVRRGSNIAPLDKLSLSTSVAIGLDGYYMLFVDGYVFIADTRYKKYQTNRLDSSFEYEWYIFDNVPASYVAIIGGKLFIGREDGRIVTPSSSYSDTYYDKIDTGSYLFGENEQGKSILYLNEELNIYTGSKVLVSNLYSHIADIEFYDTQNGKVRLYLNHNDIWTDEGYLRLYPRLEIYLLNNNGQLVATTICEVNVNDLYIVASLEENIDTYVGIFQKNDREPYILERENDHFLLLDKYSRAVSFLNYEGAGLLCERSTPVVAEYATEPLFSEHNRVTVYGASVGLMSDSQGMVEIGYETNESTQENEEILGEVIDFDKLDFGTLTFNASLQKVLNFRCFERNIEYLILKLRHISAKPFSLRDYQVTYKEEG